MQLFLPFVLIFPCTLIVLFLPCLACFHISRKTKRDVIVSVEQLKAEQIIALPTFPGWCAMETYPWTHIDEAVETVLGGQCQPDWHRKDSTCFRNTSKQYFER